MSDKKKKKKQTKEEQSAQRFLGSVDRSFTKEETARMAQEIELARGQVAEAKRAFQSTPGVTDGASFEREKK